MKMIRMMGALLAIALAYPAHAGSLTSLFGGEKQDYLAPDAAFGLEISALDGRTLLANFKVTPGYYLYHDKIAFALKAASAKAGIRIAGVTLPKGETKQDPTFGTMEVYHQPFQAEIRLEREAGAGEQILSLDATYQGCADKGL